MALQLSNHFNLLLILQDAMYHAIEMWFMTLEHVSQLVTPDNQDLAIKLSLGWVRFLCSWDVIDLESRLQNRCRALQHSQPRRLDQRTVAQQAIANCPRPQSQ